MADIKVLSPPNFDSDTALESLYRFQVQQATNFEKEQYTRAKGTVASLIDSYHKADSQALQEDIVNMMKGYTSALPTSLRAAVQPYIEHGPTSPMAEKARQFRNFMGDPPKPPVLNEAPGEVAEWQNIQAISQHYFNNEDYQRKREIFMLGSDAARPKANFFMFPNGEGAAVRNKDGRIMFLNKQDLGFKEIEEKYDIKPRELILGNGEIPTGKTGFFAKDGRIIETKEYMNFADGTYRSTPTNTRELPKSAFYQQYPANLVKLSMDWKNPGTDDEGIVKLRKRANEGKKEAALVSQELSTLFPGYQFTIITNKDPLWKRIMDWIPLATAMVTVGQDSALIPIKGVPIRLPKGSGGDDILYYDPDTDRVYDALSRYIGSYEDAARIVKSK